MLKKKLLKLGLSENEIKIYLYILEHGNCTIRELIRKTGLSVTRQTIYNLINQLEDKGLIQFSHDDKNRYIEASPPNSLRLYLDKKQEELDKHKTEVTELINDLYLHKNLKIENRAVFEIYEGDDVINSAKKHILSHNDKDMLIKTFYLPFDEKEVLFGRTLDTYRKKRITDSKIRTMGLRSINEDNPSKEIIARIKSSDTIDTPDNENVINRFLPKSMYPFEVEIVILPEAVLILNIHTKPMNALVVKDMSLRQTLESIFDVCWLMSKQFTQELRERVLKEDKKSSK